MWGGGGAMSILLGAPRFLETALLLQTVSLVTVLLALPKFSHPDLIFLISGLLDTIPYVMLKALKHFLISQQKHPLTCVVYSGHMLKYPDTQKHESHATLAHISNTNLTALIMLQASLCDMTVSPI